MAGTYTSYFQSPIHIKGFNLYIDCATFTDDTSTATVTATFPMNTIMFAEAKQSDAANAVLECTLSANKVEFKAPTSGKTYQCLVIGKM